MNFVDKFDAGLSGAHSGEHLEVSPHHGATDTIAIPDANLLFTGDFKRSGPDLILSKDGHDLVVSDYFKDHTRAALASPDGAQLSGSIVDALTGHVEYAQADGSITAAKVIGHVTKIAGGATAIRNGVSIELHMGDNVNKGDVVQAGADSSLGLTFIDGTIFGLSSNARMVLNEMVYDPNGSSNSSLLSLVQGTITFLAGETAKHGDMKVNTPVATMGIRGTAVLVEIDFQVPGQGNAPPVKFQVLVEPGGRVGDYLLYSLNDPNTAIGEVNAAGQVTSVNGSGGISTSPALALSPIAQEILQFALPQIFDANPHSTGPNGSTPANPVPGSSNPNPLKFTPLPDQPVGQPTTIPINLPGNTPFSQPTVIPVTFTVLKSIDVTPVVNKANFLIGDQVTIQDANPTDTLVPYVPGTAKIISAVGPPNGPSQADLEQLLTLDQQTGLVSYDPAKFAFLAENQKVVITIGFESSAGSQIFQEILTETINGVKHAPVIASATVDVAQGGAVVLHTSDIVVVDPDSTNFTFTVSNVIHGVFQTTTDGIHWFNATTFTTADLNAGHVRFVQDGSAAPPTFSIQADDGAATNHLSSVTPGSASLDQPPVIQPPQVADPGPIHAPAGTPDGHGGFTSVVLSNNFTFTDADFLDSHIVTATFDAGASHLGTLTAPIGTFALNLLQDSTGGNQGVVNWSLTLSSADLQNIDNANFLPPGSMVHEVFDVTVNDGHGGTAERQVSIEIDGPPATPIDNWTGAAGDREWSNAGNWDNGVPVANSEVNITGGVTVKFDSSASPGTIDTLSIKAGATLDITHGTLTVSAGGSNAGLIKVEHGSLLQISGAIDNTGGTIEAFDPSPFAPSTVALNSAQITHGKVEAIEGGKIDIATGISTIDAAVTIDCGSELVIENGATLNLSGTLDNAGLIQLDGTLDVGDGTIHNTGSGVGHGIVIDSTSTLLVDTVHLRLTGGGVISLEGGTIAAATSDAVLDNIDNTISGTGTIGTGDRHLTLHNDRSGTIDATGTLILDTGNTITNHGLLEATHGGTLDVRDDTIDNTGACFDDGIVIDATSKLLVDTHILHLTGGGVVSLEGGKIAGQRSRGDAVLDNVNNTIFGFGTIGTGDRHLTLHNDRGGTIDATGTLVLDTGNTITNHGLLEATDGGTLEVRDDAIDNTGACFDDGIVIGDASTLLVDTHILHLNGGGVVSLDGGKIVGPGHGFDAVLDNVNNTISGTGTIGTSDGELRLHNDRGGVIDATHGKLTLDTGHTIENAGLLEATHHGTLDVRDDTIDNTGACFDDGIVIDATSKLLVDTHILHLTGGGVVLLKGGKIVGPDYDSDSVLDNVNNTISGTGTIGTSDGELRLHNDRGGVIDATGGKLTLDTGHIIENAGLLEATHHGTLDVRDNTIDNTGACFDDGIVIDATSKLLVDTHSLGLTGGGNVLLEGGTITENIDNILVHSGAVLALDNVDNMISGDGHIGSGTITIRDHTIGSLHLSNEAHGTIDANICGTALTIDTGNTITNNGLLEATSGGKLVVDDAVTGSGSDKIGYGSTLEFKSHVAATQTVTFEAATGTLKLDDPAHFTGEIAGITGNGQVLDLGGFAADDTVTAKTGHHNFKDNTTTLTVTDSNTGKSVHLTLAGDYSQSTWSVTSDGNGGVDIVDPPATPSGSTMVAATGIHHPSTGTGPSDNFVFNFADAGQPPVTNFHADTDLLHFTAAMFASAQAILHVTHDDGHGGAAIAPDTHDSITLAGVAKAQLHQTDFHLV